MQRPDFIHWPLATPFPPAAGFIVIVVAAFLLGCVFSYAFARLGISRRTASPVLLACLIGSAVNIPVPRLGSRAVRVEPYVSVFGLRYFVPAMRKRVTGHARRADRADPVNLGKVPKLGAAAGEESRRCSSTLFTPAGFQPTEQRSCDGIRRSSSGSGPEVRLQDARLPGVSVRGD
jgi:hypothetical protein